MAEPKKQEQTHSESDSSNVEILRPQKLPEMDVCKMLSDSSGRLSEDPVEELRAPNKMVTKMMSFTSGRCTIY